jgi:hypothetical protein
MIMLGCPLRDSLLVIPYGISAYDSESAVAPDWKEMWRAKEEAMRVRLQKQVNKLDNKAHDLPPLVLGDTVWLRNMNGTHPREWDRTGVITQISDNGQYLVRVDRSHCVTLRNTIDSS